MPRDNAVTVLDIGTSEIRALQVREIAGREPELLAIVSESSEGVRRGVVENVSRVSHIIRRAIEKFGQGRLNKISGVLVNIDGGHIFLMSSKGGVAVSRADQRISQGDIDRALSSAQALSLPPNKEVLDSWPREFMVDQERGIKEPLGMHGIRLEVEILALCGFSPYIKNLTEAVTGAGLQVFDIIPSALAAGRAVLSQRQKELGCAVLDIGARTTNLAIFEEGELLHVAVFPVGSANVTDDIAIGLRIDVDEAERIKREAGLSFRGRGVKLKVFRSKTKSKKTAGGKNEETQEPADSHYTAKFSQKTVAKIIEARLRDIFDEVNGELKKISKYGLLPGGVVLTGGGSQMLNLLDLAKKELRLPCQLGYPKGIKGLDKDPSLSVACGLVLEALDLNYSASAKMPGFGITAKIKEWFNMFVP